MYALVEIGGKQYKAEQDARIKVDRLPGTAGDVVELPSVLMVRTDQGVKVGKPYVDGAQVKAEIEEQGRDPKITVYKYKRRKGYRRKHGHRCHYSVLRIRELPTA